MSRKVMMQRQMTSGGAMELRKRQDFMGVAREDRKCESVGMEMYTP